MEPGADAASVGLSRAGTRLPKSFQETCCVRAAPLAKFPKITAFVISPVSFKWASYLPSGSAAQVGWGVGRETDENNRRDHWIGPQTAPTLREETNGVTPRTDHMSRTNTTATRRRGGTRGAREATATKNKERNRCTKGSCTKTKH